MRAVCDCLGTLDEPRELQRPSFLRSCVNNLGCWGRIQGLAQHESDEVRSVCLYRLMCGELSESVSRYASCVLWVSENYLTEKLKCNRRGTLKIRYPRRGHVATRAVPSAKSFPKIPNFRRACAPRAGRGLSFAIPHSTDLYSKQHIRQSHTRIACHSRTVPTVPRTSAIFARAMRTHRPGPALLEATRNRRTKRGRRSSR